MQFVFGVEAHSLGMIIGSLVAALLAVALVNFVSLVPRMKKRYRYWDNVFWQLFPSDW